MLTLTRPASADQKDEVQIHVRLIDNRFYQNNDAQMQELHNATGMSYAPFVDFFTTMVNNNVAHALNSPLYQAFQHCFPDKQVVIDAAAPPYDRVRLVNVKISKDLAISIIGDLVERCQDDYVKMVEVQAIANVVETAQPDTYLHWIRLARMAAVGEALDQIHIEKD